MHDGQAHPEETSGTDRETALGRAAVYGFLAGALLYPRVDTRQRLRSDLLPVLEGLSTASSSFDELLGDALAGFGADLEELRRAHGRVFTHIENEDCPAHESAYSPGDVFRRADVMADVAAFYRAHGLQVGGRYRERVDHITTELEFVSFLARKEAYALQRLGSDEIDECRRSQAHFLRDHLGCWAPGFAARLRLVADHPFFMTLGSLLSTWVQIDLDRLAVVPAARWTEPQPPPARDDGSCGTSPGLGATPVEIRSGAR